MYVSGRADDSAFPTSNTGVPQGYSTCLCLPVIIKGEVVGILEISDSHLPEGFGVDEEMLGVVSANFLSSMLFSMKQRREQTLAVKFRDVVIECFEAALKCDRLEELERLVYK